MRESIKTKQFDSNLNWHIIDPITDKKYYVEYSKTRHFEKRICQRNFEDDLIKTVFDYGKTFFKQGLIFYVLGKNNLPKNLPNQKRKRYKDVIVVVCGDTSQIITAYRSKKPFKHVKKKQNRLFSKNAA